MKPIKGIVQNIRPQDVPEGFYFFGKNGIQNDTIGAVQNEKGTSITAVSIPGVHIGTIEVDKARAVVMSLDLGVSKIGFYNYDTQAYTSIITDADLDKPMGFTLDHWITGEFQRNFKDEVVIVFTDKTTFPKILNCDNPNLTTLDELRLFLQATTPTLITSVTTGGSLEKGAYFVAVKYKKDDGSQTDVVAISRPAIISSPNAGSITDKAVTITLSNLDTHYDKVQLFFISRLNGDYKAYEGPELQLVTTINYTYTGEELFPIVSLEELLIPSPIYKAVGTIGQLNDALYLADLTKEPETNLQQYANLVKIRVKSELLSVIPGTPSHISGETRSLMHQEVYAIYLRYHKIAGGWTKFFHIPGNTPLPADLITGSNTHEADLVAQVFQVRDTNRNLLGTACDTGIWVNNTETYPDLPEFDSSSIGGRNLRTKHVLHHRMPSIAFCKENFYAGNSDYGKTKLDTLSLEVSNVTIPSELVGVIDGYEIAIAKRTLSNSLVLGQGLVLLAAQPRTYIGTGLSYVSTGGNWHSMTINVEGSGLSGNFQDGKALIVTGRTFSGTTAGSAQTAAPGARFRFHSFDMLFNRPAVTPSFLSAQLKMRINGIAGEGSGYLEDGELDEERVPIMAILDYSKGTTPTVPTVAQRTRVLQDTQYVPNGVNTGEYQNGNLETVFAGKIKWIGNSSQIANNDLPLDIAWSTVNKANYQRPGQRFSHEETYLANLMDIKPDLYQVFYSQRLIASGTFSPIGTAINQVYAGDTFISEYSFHTYGWFDGENHPGNNAVNPSTDGGYKIVRRCLCEAVSNIALRYEVAGNIYSKWWPHDPLIPQPTIITGYLYDFDRNFDPNQFGYSRDLNTLNEFGNYEPFNPFLEDITEFPYRIHRGGKLPRQGKLRSWRNFLPLDYYEIQKDKGRIVRVVGKDDKLLIHTENALFRTQDKTKLESDILSVTLGTGDIFQFEPQEALSAKQGYAGTQHELAAIDTPYGYIFVDAKQGQIFMYKDGLKLMNQGLNSFFRQYLKGLEDKNVYTGNGITIGYDADYKRVILTVKNNVLTTGIANFVPCYQRTSVFFNQLVEDVSVVYAFGRYVVFRGEVDCPIVGPSVTINCGDTIELNLDQIRFVGTSIASLTVTNPNLVAPLYFEEISGDITNNFSIDPTTGDLILDVQNTWPEGSGLDITRTIVVKVTDPYGNEDTCSYVLHLTRNNGYPILFGDNTSEGQPDMGSITVTVNDGAIEGTTVYEIDASQRDGHDIDIYIDPSASSDITDTFEITDLDMGNGTANLVLKTGVVLNAVDKLAYEINMWFEDQTNNLISKVIIKVLVIPPTEAGNGVIFVDECATTSTIVSVKDQDSVSLVKASDSVENFPVTSNNGLAIVVPGGTTELEVETSGAEEWTRIIVVDSTGAEQCQNLIPATTTYTFTGINSLGTGKTYITMVCDMVSCTV